MTHYGALLTKKVVLFLLLMTLASRMALAFPSLEGIQVYQKNIHSSPEKKQILAEDIDRYHNADNLWEVLRNDFRLPHYEDDPQVQEQIDWFMNHQGFLLRSTTRAAPYLYYILQQAKKRNLPVEVVLLPIFESSYDPYAYSSAGAAGIWQMMPGTASGYGIKHTRWYDGRRDVIASTKAALNYLAYLGNFFDNNWLLSIAAYDTGEGNVLNAIRRNIHDGKNADFWSLPLAQETRVYVPRLLALATIIAHPEKYPVYLPPVRNAPYLAQIDVGGQIDLKHAASLAGLSLKALMTLNPGYSRTATDPNGPFKLVLPIENVAEFTENLAMLPLYRPVNREDYKIKPGDTLLAIGKRFNVAPNVLRRMNGLANNNIKPGNYLMIPRTVPAISKHIMDSAEPVQFVSSEKENIALSGGANDPKIVGHYTLQPGDTVYITRRSDNFDNIARRFHTSANAIRAVNHLNAHQKLHAGLKLVIPTHVGKTQLANVGDQRKANLSPGDTIYMVRRGDTMSSVAKKFHTTPPSIRVSNLLASDDLHEGDRLVIPTHL